ncbi:hypothetical protein BP6252_03588 [Coleophoma cylindrospora]|uniref:Uncharacterized protein n=1 Tax=Coleophoma cylindrospora TaxID=1849047 RepID=A0A3D8S834_9HELO|nr:hypothetical protein BP6252_03588 [Coleophoma cylindrospora]
MSMSTNLLAGGVAGALFGVALVASGVFSPSIIIAQMHLQDFHMLKVFLGGSATSALIIVAFEKLGVAKCLPRQASPLGWVNQYDGNVLGGLLIGVGMSLTGACPGTSLVQLSAGVRSSYFVVTGGLVGGIAYLLTAPYLRRDRPAGVSESRSTLYEQIAVDRRTAVVAYELLCLSVISTVMMLETSRKDLLPSWIGGLLIGGAQASSLLLTGNLVGVSGAYGELAQIVLQSFRSLTGTKLIKPAAISTNSLPFAAGIVAGSAMLLSMMPPTLVATGAQVSDFKALAGGFAMVFGARTAGGCTSGHGISGMSMLSVSSIISVASMFGGGIAFTALFL